VRQLINAVPIRVTAAHHDTSIRMIERTYSKHINDHSEALVRRALLDAAVVSDNGAPLRIANLGDPESLDPHPAVRLRA
jgi:hypothetical protein